MDKNRLNIGVYYLRPPARTEAHIRDLAECGVDFVVSMDCHRPTLDLFAKYGIAAIVSDVLPHWWGGKGENAGTLAEKNPLDAYDAAAGKFTDHPAICGLSIGDEPSALDFPHYGRIYRQVQALFPEKFPFLNLYPNYGCIFQNTPEEITAQLGAAGYEAYLAQYCAHVPAPYISYDHYLYTTSVPTALENLRIAAEACQRTGRSLWIVLQVNSYDPQVWISENQLRFQAFSALAYGAANILWACYSPGWWHNHVLDKSGEKTQQYEKLRAVNRELHTLGAALRAYTPTATAYLHRGDWKGHVFREPEADSDTPVLASSLTARDGAEALFLLAADDPYDRCPGTTRITFRCPGYLPTALGGNGPHPIQPLGDDRYAIRLPSNAAVLLTAQMI